MLAHALVAALLLSAAPSPKAKAAITKGESSLAAGKVDEAESAFREAIAASPDAAAAHNGLGSVLFKKGDRKGALASFKKSVELDAGLKLGWYNLGYAARKEGDFQSAAQAYEKYLALDPNDADGYYGLGESYRELGQAEKAIAAYETFVAKEKRASEKKWVDRAQGHIQTLKAEVAKQRPPATPATPTPTETAPTGTGNTVTGKVPLAPPNLIPNANFSRQRMVDGDRALAARQVREASLAYLDAVNLDPQSVEAQFKLANSLAQLGYFERAIGHWSRVVELSDDASTRKNAEDNIARAKVKISQANGGSPQAQNVPPGAYPIPDATRAEARKLYERGVQQFSGRDYAGAIESLSQSIRMEPNLSVAYAARGSARIGLRRFAEAAEDYAYALKLDPQSANPLYGLAESYRGLGMLTDARVFYERYLGSRASDVQPQLKADAQTKLSQLGR